MTTRLVRDEPSRPDCWKCRLVRDLEKTALVKTMSVFVEVSLLDVQERNSMAFVLDIHTKFRTLRETNLRAMPSLRMNLVSRNAISNELCHI